MSTSSWVRDGIFSYAWHKSQSRWLSRLKCHTSFASLALKEDFWSPTQASSENEAKPLRIYHVSRIQGNYSEQLFHSLKMILKKISLPRTIHKQRPSNLTKKHSELAFLNSDKASYRGMDTKRAEQSRADKDATAQLYWFAYLFKQKTEELSKTETTSKS